MAWLEWLIGGYLVIGLLFWLFINNPVFRGPHGAMSPFFRQVLGWPLYLIIFLFYLRNE